MSIGWRLVPGQQYNHVVADVVPAMTKVVRILGVLLLASASACAASGAAVRPQRYGYTAFDPLDGYRLHISLDNESVFIGDAGREAKQCPQADEFVCLESRVFKFAVPKHPLCPGASWSRGGQDFKVVGRERAVAFGRSYDISVIVQKAGEQEVATYLYSPRSGLVGFAFLEKPGKFSPMYLMKDKVGFGAMAKGIGTQGDGSSGPHDCEDEAR